MATLSVLSTFPASGVQGVPLGTSPYIWLDGLDYDSSSLEEGLFLEGPDTDQYIGPGQLTLVSPNNTSQGDIDDFLQSPGLQGIVPGSVTVTGIGGNTKVIFDPTSNLSPLVEYTMNLGGVQEGDGTDIDGFFTTAFVTGSGSIVAVPEETSETILSQVASEASAGVETAFEVDSVTPADYAIETPTSLDEIVVKFNKAIDSSSVAGRVSIVAKPATDHPNASTTEERDLAFTTTVEGDRLKIKI